jgi:hypothetical protein
MSRVDVMDPAVYWNPEQYGTPGGRSAPAPRKQSSSSADIRALAARRKAQEQALLDSIRNKVVYANAIGRPDPSLIPMGELDKIGIAAGPTAQGLPYGIDPRSLTTEEREYLGMPSASLYGGG